MRQGIYWFGQDDVARAVGSGGHHRKLVVPAIRPDKETRLLRSQWQRTLRGKSPVVQSEHLQLSYTDEKCPQRNHWHRLQVESYFSTSPMIVAAMDVDERLRDSGELSVEFIPAGRVFIPPRFCHLVRLTGLTEVMQIRVEPGSIENDHHTCEGCPTAGCRCAEMAALIEEAAKKHLG